MTRVKKKESLTIDERLEAALVLEEEQPYVVPGNWCWVNLNALISEIKNGTTAKQDKSGEGYKVTRIESLQNQTIDFERLGTIVDEASIKDSDWYREGDITLSHINSAEHVGKTALIEKDMLPLVHGMNLLRIRFFSSLNPKLFQFYTQSFQYKEAILKRINMAVNQVSINQRQIGTIEIPLPPIMEQNRIVECVESLFSKLDEAQDKAQEALDSFENRKASILYSAFTGELSKEWRNSVKKEYQQSLSPKYEDSLINKDVPCELPDTWCWVKMGALGYTNIGLTYSPADKSEEGVIVLRSSNIQDGQMDYEDIVRVRVDIPENKMCKKGDLLICARNGSKSLVGKTAIIDRDGMSFGAFMAIFRSEYNQFIYYFLSSPFFRNLIDNDVGTTTINQVTQGIIKNLMFPLPPKHEQDYIVSKLDDILNKERETRDIAQQTIVSIDAVKKAILAKAFRGELGTNDPEDESAVDLLKSVLEKETW